MPTPQFHDGSGFVRHSLEDSFNSAGWDMLSAIQRGFRAQVDVKGKLAELYLHWQLQALKDTNVFSSLSWRDQDGVPDFLVTYRGRDVQIECKNIRSPVKPKARKTPVRPAKAKPVVPPQWKVEIQKTRNQLTGGPARGYRVDEFDILAACLFNQSGSWDYLFIRTADLIRRPKYADYLEIMQPVPRTALGHWKATIEEVLS